MDITVTLSDGERSAEVIVEDVAYAPEVIRDCFTRCGEALFEFVTRQRVVDERFGTDG